MANFQKKVEDFICDHCGFKVLGHGYTNHCPQCFYSKHVDVEPGDRAELCQGLMPTIFIEYKKGKYVLTQQCQKCGMIKKNKLQDEDNFDNLVKLQKEINDKIIKK